MQQRILTGITTTGIPHLGNYAGAIRPAITASLDPGVESFFFLADYHGLIKCADPELIEHSRIEVAAAWLASGLDPERVFFYRQSDIPETLELNWLLTCVTHKGLMNRAHAYKAAIDSNKAAGVDVDADITMGLYCYPILMAADILLFRAHKVPVGQDQLQHLEMVRDLAQRFNQFFGLGAQILTLPEAMIGGQVLLPGLDGRKMSKSYDNTIPLFAGGYAGLQAGVSRIVTDSQRPGDTKNPESNPILTLYSAFATVEEIAAFRAELVDGLSWGEAKFRLVQCVERELMPMRERYNALVNAPGRIEDILQMGADKARALARPLLAELRDAVGLRSFTATTALPRTTSKLSNGPSLMHKPPKMRQYRDEFGAFYFKLVARDERVLVLGGPFDSGADAGQCIQALHDANGDISKLPNIRVGEGLVIEDVEDGLRAWIESVEA
jgi:tryptophanyl-tRNA synthetase